jgi:hypothetical protein
MWGDDVRRDALALNAEDVIDHGSIVLGDDVNIAS